MSAAARLAAFAVALAAIFAGSAAVGSAVGPLERGRQGDRHTDEPQREFAPAGLAVADGGVRLFALRTLLGAGKAQTFTFRIVDRLGQPVRSYDATRGGPMNVVVVRRDLTGFQHVRPKLLPDGTWAARLKSITPGAYRAFAEFSTAGERRVLGIDLFVGGRAPLRRVPAPGRVTLVGPYQVFLNSPQPFSGDPATLRFSVRREGVPLRPERAFGTRGHLVVLREGDLAYLHVDARSDELAFETTFPSPGRYRAFLEFAADGQMYTAPYTLDVVR